MKLPDKKYLLLGSVAALTAGYVIYRLFWGSTTTRTASQNLYQFLVNGTPINTYTFPGDRKSVV